MGLKVQYNKPNVYTVGGVRLVPGINILELSEEDEKAFRNHPHVKERVKKGILSIAGFERAVRAEVEDDVEGDSEEADDENTEKDVIGEDDDNDSADPRPVKEILADLPEVVDIAYLRALVTDKRVTVAKAAQARLDKVMADSEPDTKPDESKVE